MSRCLEPNAKRDGDEARSGSVRNLMQARLCEQGDWPGLESSASAPRNTKVPFSRKLAVFGAVGSYASEKVRHHRAVKRTKAHECARCSTDDIGSSQQPRIANSRHVVNEPVHAQAYLAVTWRKLKCGLNV
jgi:hypothetical protein